MSQRLLNVHGYVPEYEPSLVTDTCAVTLEVADVVRISGVYGQRR
jgi:hypothetical protein